MSKRLILGIVLAVVASAITASAVVVVGQQGGSEPNGTKIAPIKALKPGEMKPPPGTPAASLALPMDYGRFRILPHGNVPDYIPDWLPPPGVEHAGGDVRESDSLDEFRDHDLFFEPPYIPAGWELTEVHAATVMWDDGSQTGSLFALEYERPQYFYIRIQRFLIGAEGQVELLAPPESGQDALILNEIRGHPAVFLYQGPLQVHFVIGNVVTYVEGVAIDFDELIKIADGLIAQMQQGSGQEPPEETYIPPIKAVEEWTPYTLPGTPVAGLALPVDYGRFHFVAPETDPGPHVQRPAPPPGVKKAGHDVKESASLDEFRGHDLFIEPPYIPAGWELVGTHAETVIWSDGSHTDSMFGLAYQRPQYFGIDIRRSLVAPEGRVRLVANPAAEVTYTLGEIRGVPVVYNRDPLKIQFVDGNVLTQIEAPVFDLDELIKIADALIAQMQQGGGQEPPDETYIPPEKALKPGEVEIPAGTPVAGLTLPMDYGRFRILAYGNVPNYTPDWPPPPGVEKEGMDINTSDTLDEFRDHDLFIEPAYIPAGWELTWAHVEAVIWDDGSRRDSTFGLQYDRPEYFYIRIKRFHIAPEGQVELLAPPASAQDALILNEIRGVPAVFAYGGVLKVHFLIGNVLTRVEGVAIDFDELIKIAEALIAEAEEASAS